jgi:hypothetical protein
MPKLKLALLELWYVLHTHVGDTFYNQVRSRDNLYNQSEQETTWIKNMP